MMLIFARDLFQAAMTVRPPVFLKQRGKPADKITRIVQAEMGRLTGPWLRRKERQSIGLATHGFISQRGEYSLGLTATSSCYGYSCWLGRACNWVESDLG